MAVLPQYQFQVGTSNQFLSPSQQDRLYSPYWTGGGGAQGSAQAPVSSQFAGVSGVPGVVPGVVPPGNMPNNHSSGPLLGQPGPRPTPQVTQPVPRQIQPQSGFAGMGNTVPRPIYQGGGAPMPTAGPAPSNYQNFGHPFQSLPEPNRPALGMSGSVQQYNQRPMQLTQYGTGPTLGPVQRPMPLQPAMGMPAGFGMGGNSFLRQNRF